jgi:tetratricopeptide (TPR) repeat protein
LAGRHIIQSDKITAMKTILARGVAFLLVVGFVCSPVWATCGGGGGGGGGGMSSSGSGSGSGAEQKVVYHVPWKLRDAKTPPVKAGLILYWFPASMDELKRSSLKESRDLSLYAGQCVTMELGDARTANYTALVGESKLPVAVLANPDGTSVSKLENTAGKLNVREVEKLVGTEVKSRKAAVDAALKEGKAKAATDKEAAIKSLQAVLEHRCMFPGPAKEASKELKKLGVENIGAAPAAPNFDPKVSAEIVSLMKSGLVAENAAKYTVAENLYTQASKLDPADPTPLRYLAELYRHHIGDWEKAKVEFNKILDMQADPLSRAIALHGLGKITIHEGEFKKGLHLMEESVDTYPTALAYRNLAVYWNSEHDFDKGSYYTQKALAMNPTDPYNLVFAADFMAMAGKKDEALKIATANINLLPASYNLAAIYAQAGQKDKALALLERHFYKYERYQDVRAKEMMEARVDAVFDSLRTDKDFLALTKHADGMLPMPMSPRQAMPMRMEH